MYFENEKLHPSITEGESISATSFCRNLVSLTYCTKTIATSTDSSLTRCNIIYIFFQIPPSALPRSSKKPDNFDDSA